MEDITYKTIFENMPGGVAYHKMVTDRDGEATDFIILEANRAFERIVGLGRDQIVGKKLSDILPDITGSMFNWIDFYGKIAQSGRETKFEQYIKGVARWYAVSAYSMEKGYFIAIYDDITERKKAEESMRKAYDTLKKTQAQLVQSEKVEVIGRLASGITHEIRNPLAIIQQGADYLRRVIHKPSKEMKFALSSIEEAVSRASNIVGTLLGFSRVSDMQAGSEDLNKVIENSLLLIKNDIMCNNIKVVAALKKGLPKVDVDKIRMEQVFINIFMNAIQAMGKGGRLRIETSLVKDRQGAGGVIVKVEDTGPGITQDIADKIFDPFFTTKEVGKGTGLGMYIVKNILTAHNADIKVCNREDKKGARVTIIFNQTS